MYEIDNRVKYNFNYLKKNIDINKFLKLAPKYKWNFNDEFFDILSGALFPSCINKNNKDPNLNPERVSYFDESAELIIEDLFNQSNPKQENFFKDGTFFEKIHPNFKLIKHITLGEEKPIFMPDNMVYDNVELYKLMNQLEESENLPPFWISPFLLDLVDGPSICAHSLIEIKNENSYTYMHTVYFSNEEEYGNDPILINLFNNKLNDKRFLEEIIHSEQKRVETLRKKHRSYLKNYNSEENFITIYRNDLKTNKPIYTFSKSGKFI